VLVNFASLIPRSQCKTLRHGRGGSLHAQGTLHAGSVLDPNLVGSDAVIVP
jgi:hypothetical protein